MGKPDLDAVTARRAHLVRELAELEKMRTDLEAEDVDLIVAERVLKRLADLPRMRSAPAAGDTPASASSLAIADGPILEG